MTDAAGDGNYREAIVERTIAGAEIFAPWKSETVSPAEVGSVAEAVSPAVADFVAEAVSAADKESVEDTNYALDKNSLVDEDTAADADRTVGADFETTVRANFAEAFLPLPLLHRSNTIYHRDGRSSSNRLAENSPDSSIDRAGSLSTSLPQTTDSLGALAACL